MKKFFIFLLIFLPTMAKCQTTTWTLSSNANGYATINASTGQLKLNSYPPEQIMATITAVRAQNGKTTTSTKQVELGNGCNGTNYPNCNNSNVFAAGLCWSACNIGANYNYQVGSWQYWSTRHQCATGWRLPTMQEAQNLISLGYSNTTSPTNGSVIGGVFFSACGWIGGNTHYNNGSRGIYWTYDTNSLISGLDVSYPGASGIGSWHSGNAHTGSFMRCVRAIN